MLLSSCANQVLQEFGGVMPEVLMSFEDAEREFLSVRALELQKLGVSTTDITVTKSTLNATQRDGLLNTSEGDGMIPAFVELTPDSSTSGDDRVKVEILPVELIPSYEGARAIGFYGTPGRYRLAWDAWDEGTLTIWYDPVEDLTSIGAATDISFPPNFFTYIFKKTALNLIRVAVAKLMIVDPAQFKESKGNITAALSAFEKSIDRQVGEWEHEFKKWRNLDLNSSPHLRRTNDEIQARGYNNVTGHIGGDFAG